MHSHFLIGVSATLGLMWGIVRANGTPLSDRDKGILRRVAPTTGRNRMRSLR